jgi:tRNA(fMet)-specific endonuclease VapC
MNPAGSVLLDTNIVVAHFRNDPGVTAHLQTAPVIYLPLVALGELQYGALRSRQREAQLALIREFLQTAILLLPDQGTSERYGQVKAELADAGKLIPDNDIWIAAMARQYDLPLATRDAHFAAVQGLNTLAW